MSGRSYSDTAREYGSYSSESSSSPGAREERRSRVHEARERVSEAPPPSPRAVPAAPGPNRRRADPAFVRNRITRPHPDAREVTVVIVDNSASNVVTSERIRETSGYILGVMGTVLGTRAQMAVVYGSDHYDERLGNYRQDVDFVFPDEQGDNVLFSTTDGVQGADGGDRAEAFECLLDEMCIIDFGHVSKENRHLVLVTDVVGHGMGMRAAEDHGCPYGRDWRRSVERVYETYGTFQVIGTMEYKAPDDPSNPRKKSQIGKLQEQFLRGERVAFDHLDLSGIQNNDHRMGIIPNAVLFLMARNRGVQTAKTFLMLLYEKWLREPIFGQASDLKAREAIAKFFEYIEGMTPELRTEWERDIFAD